MSCALTQGLNLDCIDSKGGTRTVYLIEHAAVTDTTITAGVVTALTKASGKAFHKYNLVKQTAMAEESVANNEENGTNFVTQTIKFYANKLQASVRNELMLLCQNRLAAVVIDQNGKGWYFGYQNALITNTIKAMTGTKLGDRNGYEIDLKGEEPVLAYEVESSIIEDLLTAGD
jgi:hypothetical protein